MYAQAVDATDAAYQTLLNYKYVAKAIEFSRRRENVAFSIHAGIASLAPDQQVETLDRAEAESWTVREARKKLGKGPHVAENSGDIDRNGLAQEWRRTLLELPECRDSVHSSG